MPRPARRHPLPSAPGVASNYSRGSTATTRRVGWANDRDAASASHPDRKPLPESTYDGFQSPAAGPASGRVSPESHDAIATISAWS